MGGTERAGKRGPASRFMAPGGLSVPARIEQDGARLTYAWEADGRTWTRTVVTRDLLANFVELALALVELAQAKGRDEFGAVVLTFARKWGPLGICRHGRSWFHDIECEPSGSEPLAMWRNYALDALRVVLAARALQHGETLTGTALQRLLDIEPDPLREPDIREQREALAKMLEWWQYQGVPHLAVDWNAEIPQPVWGHSGVLSAICVELMKVATGSGGMEVCSVCGRPYSPTRPITPGVPRCCDPCRAVGELVNRRARTYRTAQAQARHMARGGRTAAQIASALRRPVDRIERWLNAPEVYL